MATIPKFCRIAIIVDDMPTFTEETKRLLGLDFVIPGLSASYPDFVLRFGEHGLEPIAPLKPLAFAADGQLIEVAIDVANAEETRALFEKEGHKPVAVSYLPVPDKNEYLFGRDFNGLPIMVCTAGDNEVQMQADGPFNYLDDAPVPKIGCVAVMVEDAARVAADFGRLFGMEFVETDPAGLGRKALVGRHRVKLIEGASAMVLEHTEKPLVSIDYMVEDVDATRAKLVAAGYPVLHTRALKSGGNAYYFGATIQRMPLTIYPSAADLEMIGG